MTCAAAPLPGQRPEGYLPQPCTAPGVDGPPGPVVGMENRSVPPGPYRATKLVRQRATTGVARRGDGCHHFDLRTFAALPWAQVVPTASRFAEKEIERNYRVSRNPCGTGLLPGLASGAPEGGSYTPCYRVLLARVLSSLGRPRTA